jgi:putative transposase
MKMIDKIHVEWPFLGSRRITNEIRANGIVVNRKKIQRLMRDMGIETAYPKKRWKDAGKASTYPYLLDSFCPISANEVWCSDITYIPTRNGYFYLMAVMDWYTRYVLAWDLSNSLETSFCVLTLKRALERGTPKVFNTDQGTQFTSNEFTSLLKENNIEISVDHKGKCFDNIFIERLWRSVKYEEVYLNDYVDGLEAYENIEKYFTYYNDKRRHTALKNKTPKEMHLEKIRQYACIFV